MDTAMNIDLSDYVAGGYFVVKHLDIKRYSESPLPDKIISISDCQGNTLCLQPTWQERRRRPVEFGVPAEKLPAFEEWLVEKRGIEFGYSSVFYTLDAARRFVAEFLSERDDILVIGIGLHHTLVDGFLAACHQEKVRLRKKDTQNSWELNLGERVGVDRVVAEGQPLIGGGKILGFDLAGYEVDFVCSWLCTGDEYRMDDKLGKRPNQYGLIDNFETAKIVQPWREDSVPDSYCPWLIVQYPPS
jgi:hypothetical protein